MCPSVTAMYSDVHVCVMCVCMCASVYGSAWWCICGMCVQVCECVYCVCEYVCGYCVFVVCTQMVTACMDLCVYVNFPYAFVCVCALLMVVLLFHAKFLLVLSTTVRLCDESRNS